MLIIGRSQLAALDAARLERFRRLVHGHVAEVLPHTLTGVADPDAMAAIDAAITRARSHALVAERDVARYVALTFALGAGFPDEPGLRWSRGILDDRTREPGPRMDELFARLEAGFPDLAPLWQSWRG